MNQQNVHSSTTSEVVSGISRSLSWKGFAWAISLPALGLLLFYSLVLDTRLVLGRWPDFGENLPAPFLSFHNTLVWDFYGVLFFSLYAVPVLLIASLCIREMRHFAVYIFAYTVFVSLAGLSTQLAPHEFLNWFFD